MKKAASNRTIIISALTARTQLGQIMRRAATKNERFVVDRRGEPSIVIMSISDYMETFAPEPNWLEKVRAKSKQRGTNALSMDKINSMISEVRRSGKKVVAAPAK